MTLNEFKAWLAGFSEAIHESPTPEQWAKVREKLALVTEPAFAPTYPPIFSQPVVGQPFTTCGGTLVGPTDAQSWN